MFDAEGEIVVKGASWALAPALLVAGCEQRPGPRAEDRPVVRIDPAILKAGRDRTAATVAQPAAPPSEDDIRADVIATREQVCASAAAGVETEGSSAFDHALAEEQRKSPGRDVDRARLVRSLNLTPAAARGDLARLRALIAQGADVNLHGPVDFTLSPLAWSARCDHPFAVDLLVRAGARVNQPLEWGFGRARYTNSSALIWASRSGADRAAESLLAHGARPMREVAHNHEGFTQGETPAEAAPTLTMKRRLSR